MYRIQRWKLFAVFVFLLLAIISCKKQKPIEGPPPTHEPPSPSSSIYEPLLNHGAIVYCGSPLNSTLKIKDGTDVGTVTVGNDSVYLYLTYTVNDPWYLGSVHCYAGQESQIPKNSDGSPLYQQFPAKQDVNFCDLRQTFSFRVPLSALTSDIGQCSTNIQYYVAMRASVKQITDPTTCAEGLDEAAWGAPFLINPGNTDDWATAFFYCKQDCIAAPPACDTCNQNPPPPAWCAYSQGYWFNQPTVTWCQSVKFGALEVLQSDGTSLWPAQNNWVKRAFFEASAIQLSMNCVNNGNAIPSSIANEYNTLQTFLSQLSYTDIQNGTFGSADTTGIRDASGTIGRWICANHCNSASDSTACSGY
jgi:hypothetical protein